MDSLVDGVNSLPKSHKSTSLLAFNQPSKNRPPNPLYLKQSKHEGAPFSSSCSYITSYDHVQNEVGKCKPSKDHKGKSEIEVVGQTAKDYFHKKILSLEAKPRIKQPVDEPKILEPVVAAVDHGQSRVGFHPSPQNSLYSATQFTEAKQSFTDTEVSESASNAEKSLENGEVSVSCDYVESIKTSIYKGSTCSDLSDESSSSSFNSAIYKPHKQNDTRWEAIQVVMSKTETGMLEMKHFSHLKRLGCEDIRSIYLSELIGTRSYFYPKSDG